MVVVSSRQSQLLYNLIPDRRVTPPVRPSPTSPSPTIIPAEIIKKECFLLMNPKGHPQQPQREPGVLNVNQITQYRFLHI